jgi:hypothetical protein
VAFTFTQTGIKQYGNGMGLAYGTWDATSVAVGTILISGKRDSATVDLTTTTATSTTLTTSGSYVTSGIQVGDLISGTGITNGTYVASIESATSLTMSVTSTDGTATSRSFTRLGGKTKSVITAKVISSTSSVTMTGAKLNAVNNTISLTCVSGDAGYWSAVCR